MDLKRKNLPLIVIESSKAKHAKHRFVSKEVLGKKEKLKEILQKKEERKWKREMKEKAGGNESERIERDIKRIFGKYTATRD